MSLKVPAAKRNAYFKAAKGSAIPPKEETSIGVWRPLPSAKPEVDPKLTEQQEQQAKALLEWTKENLALPEDDPYAAQEMKYIETENCMARFLKAVNWKEDQARKRVQATLEWRREYKPDLIPPNEIREETEGGKIIVSGFDNKGRPVMYLRPARETTDPSPTQIRHMIFQLERAVELLPPHVSKLLLIIDYAGATSKSNPSIKTAKSVVDILQNHYAERLGQAVVVNCPWYLKGIFSTISPFLDPATREKLQMNPKLEKMIPKEQLDAEFGGDYNFKYDWQVYLPAICKFCGINDDGSRVESRPPMNTTMSQASKILHKENGEGSVTGIDDNEEADSGSATAVDSSPEEEPKAEKKPVAAVAQKVKRSPSNASRTAQRKKTQVTFASNGKSSGMSKKEKKRRGLLGCFGPNGLDEEDPAVKKAASTQGVSSGVAQPASANDGAAAELREQQALDTDRPAADPITASEADKQDAVNSVVTKEAEQPAVSKQVEPVHQEEKAEGQKAAQPESIQAAPATMTESLTKAVNEEAALLSQAASQLVASVWGPAANDSQQVAKTGQAESTSGSGFALPSLPALPAVPAMPALFSRQTEEEVNNHVSGKPQL